MNLRQQIERDEGRVSYVYEDSLGFHTIGVGHLVDKRRGGGLPGHIIDALLDHDIGVATTALLERFPWMATLDPPRLATMVNMAFQLGVTGLAQFHDALGYLQRGEYTAASLAFADSKVAKTQAPDRWKRHAQQLKTGEWQ